MKVKIQMEYDLEEQKLKISYLSGNFSYTLSGDYADLVYADIRNVLDAVEQEESE